MVIPNLRSDPFYTIFFLLLHCSLNLFIFLDERGGGGGGEGRRRRAQGQREFRLRYLTAKFLACGFALGFTLLV
ncbi:hypothetical protein BGZ63DRAFT_370111 [Mariannaea sp. PMI_226]|nr:hypothetical protein BGZ63DRAFT_370111 [Mariannaea sp. PMI_226]